MTIAPARDTTADVIMLSAVFNAPVLRSDQSQTPLRTATTVAMIIGTNSGRSSLAGIVSLLNSIRATSLPKVISKELRCASSLPDRLMRAQ
jgi:hypothetical protein